MLTEDNKKTHSMSGFFCLELNKTDNQIYIK
jgi:hypothetical protein